MTRRDYKERLLAALERTADALERLSPPAEQAFDPKEAPAFLWRPEPPRFAPVFAINAPPLALLLGCDAQKQNLLENTQRFATGAAANNALLWGARGVGKSALVKAVFVDVAARNPALTLIEINREDIQSLPDLMRRTSAAPARFVIFCDDLSFEAADTSYKALKAALEGGVEGRPDNVLFYATSNRKHLTPREMRENEDAVAIRRGEAGQETLSLADRFGLSLGFYALSQDDYLGVVRAYAARFELLEPVEDLEKNALIWAAMRGGRSGRVAWQFIQDRLGAAGRAAQF